MKYNTIKLNWCESHIIETCFPDLFFSDESNFYLITLLVQDGLRVRKTIYMQKIKEENLGHGLQLAQDEKKLLYLYEQNINTQNYLKVLEEAIEEMKELSYISRDCLFLQIDNARYHWSIEVLSFIMKII